MNFDPLRERLNTLYQRANSLTQGRLDIVRTAVIRYNQAQVPRAAAGLAYYALFALFPLLIVLVAIASFFLEGESAILRLVDTLTTALPISENLIRQSIQRILELRRTLGLASLVGLIWSASGAFALLVDSVNRAWPEAERRNFLERRLAALGIVGTLAGLFSAIVILTAGFSLLSQLRVPLAGNVSVYETTAWSALANLTPWLLSFFLFASLYRWIPNTEVSWSAAASSGLMMSLVWEVLNRTFSWYLRSELARFELIYGSLSAVVTLMLWVYISSLIVLFGAHLSAAIAGHAAERTAL